MDLTALLLSRLQFAFTISFHIIFPSFTIGLAAWLTVLEALHLWTGRPAYRQVFEFWLKIFGVAFGMGVVSGIVMGLQFGTNWSVLARMSGPIQGPLLSYEIFTAFFLEASFFGILLFGRSRARRRAGSGPPLSPGPVDKRPRTGLRKSSETRPKAPPVVGSEREDEAIDNKEHDQRHRDLPGGQERRQRLCGAQHPVNGPGLGSAHSRCCAVSGFASATRCSARAGW
jgi:hypothetical protein